MEVALVYLALLVGAFFFLIVRPQRRQMAAHRALVATLEVGDRVVTSSGIFGTIRALEDETAVVEIAPGVDVTLARAAIARRLDEAPEDDEIDVELDDEEPSRPDDSA
jgi:preprotein translocase subunit YajC